MNKRHIISHNLKRWQGPALVFIVSVLCASVVNATTLPINVDAVHPSGSSRPVSELIKGHTTKERATLKGQEIAKIGRIEKVRRGEYSIEVESMEAIPGGLQVFARAWDANNNQVGFGKDGSVEIERFRIFNPPIMVPDGTKRMVVDPIFKNQMLVDNFKEDPRGALLQTLAHIVSVKKERFNNSNILRGKVGNTSDAYYPDANTESTSVDGTVGLYGSGYDSSAWTSARNAASGPDYLDDSTFFGRIMAMSDSGYNRSDVARVFTLFDTSALPDGDTISAATLSLHAYGNTVDGTDANSYIAVVSANPASNTSLAANDYDDVGSIELSNEQSYPFSTSSSTDFFLNENGIANITNTSVSKFAFRSGHDLNNSMPNTTNYGGGADQVYPYMADQFGSTNDPILVVEHSAAPFAPTALQVESLNNPTGIATSNPRFSAVHENASTTALASYYQIQIATSSSYWGAPYWDSGKKTLSSSTPQSQRSPQIYSTTTFPLDGGTYYWRIKFWDQLNSAGLWSTTTSSFGMATELTITASGDGYVETAPYPGSWSSQHDATNGHLVNEIPEQIQVKSQFYVTDTGYQTIKRGFLTFDTSQVPTSSQIISSQLNLFAKDVFTDYGGSYGYVNLYQGFQSSTSSLSNYDINDCGDATTSPTAGSSNLSTGDISASTTVVLTLNSTATGWINKGNYTKLCMREGHDSENHSETWNGASWKFSGVTFYSSSDTMSSRRPTLTVLYQ